MSVLNETDPYLSHCTDDHPSKHIVTALKWKFFFWYIPLCNHVATILTFICLIVLLKHPKVFAPSTRVWFFAILANDVFVLLIASNDNYAELFFREKYRTLLSSIFYRDTCRVRQMFLTFLLWTSMYLQTGLSIERLLSVLLPIKTRILFTAKITKCVVLSISTVILLSAVTVNLISFERAGENQDPSDCIRQSNRTDSIDMTSIAYNIDLYIFKACPLIVMLISSTIIAILLKYQRFKRQKLVYSVSRSQRRVAIGAKNRQSRASVLLLVMNITTLITNPIFLIFELLDGFSSENLKGGKLTGDTCLSQALSQFFNVLLYFNNQTNCIFFIAFGSRFRKHIMSLCFCCGKLPFTCCKPRDGQYRNKSVNNDNSTSIAQTGLIENVPDKQVIAS